MKSFVVGAGSGPVRSSFSEFSHIAVLPPHISDAIQEFADVLEPEKQPFYLDVEPTPWASVGQCYDNAVKLCKLGIDRSVVYGWCIWELKDSYLVAEHHAITKLGEADGGGYRDCTPQADDSTRILFLPSNTQAGPDPTKLHYKVLGTGSAANRLQYLLEKSADLIAHGKYLTPQWKLVDAEAVRCIEFLQAKAARRRKEKKVRGK